MKKQILFVDDQPELLRGLRRMLFDMSSDWDMEFAEGGQQALDILEKSAFDVVVSDMRMPGMDGAELLTRVKEQYPRMIRIILSGYSDKELIFKSVGATHQFLAKPLDGKKLKEILTRAFILRDILSDSNLKKVVGDIRSLPSMPTIYQELVSELQKPDVTMKKLGDIVSRDVGMTAKMMQLVNSAFFGLPIHVEDPIHAAKLLGPDTLRALVLSVQIFSKFEKLELSGLSIEQFTNHSMTVGTLAKEITLYEKQDKAIADNALIAGMLHDVGKLILAQKLPDKYGEVLTHAKKEDIGVWKAEKCFIGTTHAEVGAYLLGLWGLPDDIIEAVAFHHEPQKNSHQNFSVLTAVHVANEIHETSSSGDNQMTTETVNLEYLTDLGLDDRISHWLEHCKKILEKKKMI